mmetsp:Transcript_30886/g.42804  ORF Transcript_30886/g.42804 Transcript_30886/m.42804 type:complete len:302 (-) Transcript_30886:731-1636(-)
MRLGREHRQRGVISHAESGLHASSGHALDHKLHVLTRVSSSSLQLEGRSGVHGALLLRVHGFHAGDCGNPLRVRVSGGSVLADLVMGAEGAGSELRSHHHARAQTPLEHHVLSITQHVAENSHLGSHIEESILRSPEPRRPQPVPVQARSYRPAVREHQESGSVPGLLHSGVVVVKVLGLGVVLHHGGMVFVRLGHQHQHGFIHRQLRPDEKLSDAVKVGGVGGGGVGDGAEVSLSALQRRVGHQGLPGCHPVQVALQRVDFAVVTNHAEGLSQRPLGGGVGRESAMVDGKGGFIGLVLEI